MITDPAEKLDQYERMVSARRDMLAARDKRDAAKAIHKTAAAAFKKLETFYNKTVDDALAELPLFDAPAQVEAVPAPAQQPPGLIAGDNLGAVMGCQANRVPTTASPQNWRDIPIAEVIGDVVASTLAKHYDVETLGHLYDMLSDGDTLEAMDLVGDEAGVIRRGVTAYRFAQGWGPEDGIPEAWLAVESAEPEPAQPTVKASDKFLLVRALHSIQNADERWASFRRLGATDSQLATQIGIEWQGDPGHANKLDSYSCKGGKKPAIWINTFTYEPPTLSGKKLIAKVREVLTIPPLKKYRDLACVCCGVEGTSGGTPPKCEDCVFCAPGDGIRSESCPAREPAEESRIVASSLKSKPKGAHQKKNPIAAALA